MSRCSHYVYVLQNELRYFGLRALANFGLMLLGGPKVYTRKIDKTHKDFELYQLFMCIFWASIPNIYIYYKKNQHILVSGYWSISSLYVWLYDYIKCLDILELYIAYKKNQQILGQRFKCLFIIQCFFKHICG